jgi:hypothetical protein
MTPMSRALGAVALLFMLLPGAKASGPPAVQEEAAYLIVFVEGSGCAFYRNGTAYDSVRAAAHLRQKYAAVDVTGAIKSAEMFIDKVASRSSMTGWPYEVVCTGHPRIAVADWLREALARFRASEASREPRDAR